MQDKTSTFGSLLFCRHNKAAFREKGKTRRVPIKYIVVVAAAWHSSFSSSSSAFGSELFFGFVEIMILLLPPTMKWNLIKALEESLWKWFFRSPELRIPSLPSLLPLN